MLHGCRAIGARQSIVTAPESPHSSNLIEQGIPADHLAAAGFGEFQPIDAGDSDDAYRKNRRIEFKLTER